MVAGDSLGTRSLGTRSLGTRSLGTRSPCRYVTKEDRQQLLDRLVFLETKLKKAEHMQQASLDLHGTLATTMAEFPDNARKASANTAGINMNRVSLHQRANQVLDCSIRFESAFKEGRYEDAATIAATSPERFLRTKETWLRFQAVRTSHVHHTYITRTSHVHHTYITDI